MKNQEQLEAAIASGNQKSKYSKPRFKWVGRWSEREKKIRLFRWMWMRGHGPGVAGKGNYSATISVGIEWKLEDLWIGVFWKRPNNSKEVFWLKGNPDELIVWVCLLPCLPIRFHYIRSYGGHRV